MLTPSSPTYSPVVDLRDRTSLPNGLGANDETHVPLPPRRDARSRAPPWIRRLRDEHRLVVNFCYSDHDLLRWEDWPGAAEAAVARWAPSAAITLDVPYYGFMTSAQRDRAAARIASSYLRAVARWEPQGIAPIPLVKGFTSATWAPQLSLAADLGLGRVAFHVRELRLERDVATIEAFAREARRRRLRPLLLGLFRWRSLSVGDVDAAAAHHYVLARRGRILDRAGHARAPPEGAYSDLLNRFVGPTDIAGLTTHNFLRARALLARPPPLTGFAS